MNDPSEEARLAAHTLSPRCTGGEEHAEGSSWTRYHSVMCNELAQALDAFAARAVERERGKIVQHFVDASHGAYMNAVTWSPDEICDVIRARSGEGGGE